MNNPCMTAAASEMPEAPGADERDIWQVAVRLVSKYGENAPECASKWGLALMETGDIEGCVSWISVMTLCKVLLSRRDSADPRMHA
jgi:hypothetical protein